MSKQRGASHIDWVGFLMYIVIRGRERKGLSNMRKFDFKAFAVSVAKVIVLLLGICIHIQEGHAQSPPVGAPLVREGAFAMKLAEALNLGHPSSEAEAESMLGAAGIAPRNGWIADYPVTPDIIGELRDSVTYAAQAKTISMDQSTALKTLEDVQASENTSVSPGPAGPPETSAEGATGGGYPDQTIINNYYSEQGPPIVTYYAPPPDFYYLYSWVPYPFWWNGFWFGGFFILHDFHRHFREDGHVFVVTNHFRGANSNRVFRIDPARRFQGRTFAGIGAPHSSNLVNAGVSRAPERVFNAGALRPSGQPRGAVGARPSPGIRSANPFTSKRVYSEPPGAGRTFTPRSSAPHGGRTSAAPAGRSGKGGGMKR
jgi:hypothetical protein